jgi:ribosome-binding ATPase YchF (GTP1/OBG family)
LSYEPGLPGDALDYLQRPYDDLVLAGSWDEAKARGRLRVEGKGYTVQEGDVLNIRFAV